MASMALALPHKPPGGSGIDGQYHPVYDHGHGPGGGEPTLHHVRALARVRAARAHAHAHAHAFGPYHPGYYKRAAGEKSSLWKVQYMSKGLNLPNLVWLSNHLFQKATIWSMFVIFVRLSSQEWECHGFLYRLSWEDKHHQLTRGVRRVCLWGVATTDSLQMSTNKEDTLSIQWERFSVGFFF